MEKFEARTGNVLGLIKEARTALAAGDVAGASAALKAAETLRWLTVELGGEDAGTAVAAKAIDRVRREIDAAR